MKDALTKWDIPNCLISQILSIWDLMFPIDLRKRKISSLVIIEPKSVHVLRSIGQTD